jgi:uncharacterized protein (TIGR02145 family)
MNKNKTFIHSRNRGSILAYALVILGMMIAIASTIAVSAIVGKKSASSTEFSVQALQTADSGVQIAQKIIKDNPSGTIASVFSCSGSGVVTGTLVEPNDYKVSFLESDGTTQLSCSDDIADVVYIKSVGTYKDTVRAVSVKLDPCGGITEIPYGNGPHNDGGPYHTVSIGSQCWLAENLNIGTYMANGGSFPHTGLIPDNGTIEKCCYNDDVNNCNVSGGLYTYGEAVQLAEGAWPSPGVCGLKIKGICPSGWHIPSDAHNCDGSGGSKMDDFPRLADFLGDSANVWVAAITGGKLKSLLTWDSPNTGADNSSSFNAVPSGYLGINGAPSSSNTRETYFWSSTTDMAWGSNVRRLKYDDTQFIKQIAFNDRIGWKVSVRCVKD